ncbi:MAG TPA: ABC transporter permease [Pyrinomonadaceae bacterium]|nr:ABC transporter permease [Pyrinomonadaceae bacterium]
MSLPYPSSYQIPDEPLVTIQPGKAAFAVNLRELWTYRELLLFLIWRDIKVRYKQTVIGAAWAVLQPLLLMLIFTFFFARFAGVKPVGAPYPLFAYAGLLPWTFFANAVTNSGNSLIGNTNLITKVYFPRILIPVAAVAASLLDFGIASVFLILLMFYYSTGLHVEFLLLPVLIALVTLLASGVGILLAALNVKYRDIRYALPFLIQLWLFASPVIYPVPNRWRWLLAINPMTAIIEGFRSALFGLPFDWPMLAFAATIIAAILISAAYAFARMERGFADVI